MSANSPLADDAISAAPTTAFSRAVLYFAKLRFLTASLLFHLALIILVGGTIMMNSQPEEATFEATGTELVSENVDGSPPPDAPDALQQPQELAPPEPKLEAPPLTALLSNKTSTFSINATALTDKSVKGMSNNLASTMSAMMKRAESGGGMGGTGKMGTLRSAMIFGRKVEAKKLGVILDVSGSAHSKLADAIGEIDKGFPDCTLILYPGCGMGGKGKTGEPSHEIRKFSAISESDFSAAGALKRSTAGQVVKALKIQEFKKITSKPNMKDRLFVSWFTGEENEKGGLTSHTDVAFENLIKNGADTIYWFADFRDPVSGAVVEELLKTLKTKKITVHLHNFATTNFPASVLPLATATGGTTNLESTAGKPPAKKGG